MNIQEQINLRVRERFLAEGIEFAYPTHTLFVERTTGTAGAQGDPAFDSPHPQG